MTPTTASAHEPVAQEVKAATLGATAPGGRRWGSVLLHGAVLIGFVVMVVFFAIARPETFPTIGTLKDVLNQAAVPVIVVCGVTFTLAVGEFDLSFPAVLSLSAGVAAYLMSSQSFGVGPAIAAAIVVAVVSGLAVGMIVVFGRASSFIVTLALSSVLIGIEQAVTNSTQIFENIPASYASLTSGSLLGFKLPVWYMLVVVAASVFLLHWTRFGRHVYAIGGNDRAAFLAGIRLRAVRISCFLIAATFAGIAAIISTSVSQSYYPEISGGLLLSSYAALFLGAAMVWSNRFTILGSAMGVVWLLTLQTGLTQLNAKSWVSTLIQGVVLAIAVLLAVRGQKGGAK